VSIFNGFKIDEPVGIKQIKLLIDEYKPKIIIFDSMVRCMVGEEDKSRDVRKIFDNLKSVLVEHPDICFLILHHTTKGANRRKGIDALRGSGDFAAFADVILMFNQNDGFVEVDVVKNRHIDRALLSGFVIKFETIDEEYLKLNYLEANPDTLSAIEECVSDIKNWYNTEQKVVFRSRLVLSEMKKLGYAKNCTYSALKVLEKRRDISKQKRALWEVADSQVIDEEAIK